MPFCRTQPAPGEPVESGSTVLMSTSDPALPVGGQIGWQIHDCEGNPLPVARDPQNHLLFLNAQPIVYCESYGTRRSGAYEIALTIADK